jgi:hypothetical protein
MADVAAQRVSAPAEDAYGYRLLRAPDARCAANWISLDAGQALPLVAAGEASADDDGGARIALPLAFEFYGLPREAAVLSSNGYLAFVDAERDEDGGDWRAHCPLPAIPDNAIASFARISALQQDLELGSGGELQWQHFETCPRQSARGDEACTVMQWVGWERRGVPGLLDFQIVLYHGSWEIALQYATLDAVAAANALIGLQDDGASSAAMASCGAVEPAASGSAICFFDPRFPAGEREPLIFIDGFE